ncbi:MAG: sigma-70 family RNA polymerase sigma factor [Clostridia bacterium]|nr:sigma-70 family RNA polymerase sigma factor [Clostridia bacterium]
MVYDKQEADRLRAARAGDDAAMASLISDQLPFIRQKAASAASVSGLDAEDLAQEGLIGLLNAVRSFDFYGGAAFRTYARTCIVNSIRSALRRATRPGAVPAYAVVPIDSAQSMTVGASDPQDIVVGKEQAKRLLAFVDKHLSEREQAVLRLYLAGCSYAAIVERLSLKDCKAVDNTLQRIRKKLKSFS